MITGSEHNPYEDLYRDIPTRVIAKLGEVPLAALNIRRTMEQKRAGIGLDTAQFWLDRAVEIGLDNNIEDVFQPGDTPVVSRRLGAGFATTTFAFETSQGDWALKIGGNHTPITGWLNPSSRAFGEWYARNLTILHEMYDNHLPEVIPTPQYVMHPESQDEHTSLVIQPLLDDPKDISTVHSEDEATRASILEELEVFYEQSEHLRCEHRMIPDLGSKGNLVITERDDKTSHLTLLDNGLVDYSAPTPMMNSYLTARYHVALRHAIRKLRKSVK